MKTNSNSLLMTGLVLVVLGAAFLGIVKVVGYVAIVLGVVALAASLTQRGGGAGPGR